MIRLRLARVLGWLSRVASHGSDLVYRSHYRSESRKAARLSAQREREELRRRDAAIDDVIAPRRASSRVGAPIHRDR